MPDGRLDLSDEGSLEVSGADAAVFLHRLLTAEIKRLAPGSGTPAFLLTSTGKIVLALAVLRVDAERFLLRAAPALAEALHPALDRFLFTERVTLTDLRGSTSALHLHGPNAAETLRAAGLPVPEGPLRHEAASLGVNTRPVRVVRNDRLGGPGFDVLLDGQEPAPATFAGGFPVLSAHEADLGRVELGRPAYPSEYSEDSSPLEVSGTFGVTESKGCYPGQEVIERTLALGAPPRALMHLQAESALEVGATVRLGETEIGRITSAASLADGRHFALALVKRKLALVDDVLQVGDVAARRVVSVSISAPSGT